MHLRIAHHLNDVFILHAKLHAKHISPRPMIMDRGIFLHAATYTICSLAIN